MSGETNNGNDTDSKRRRRRLIVADVDVGIDDAWALFMLLKAETVAHPLEHRLLAITCVNGNTNVDQVASNVLRVLDCAGRTDIPVYIGAGRALIEPTGTEPFNGHDGLGDVPVVNNASSTIDRRPLRPEHAVNALHRIVCLEHEPHSVTLVCCAPLTNLALAIRMYGTAFLRRCRDIYMMGGNYNAVGNMPQRCCAEYNFFADPEAAKIVLEACAEAGVPVTVLPWEACTRRTLPGLDVSWRFDVLGGTKQQQQQHPILRWMEPLERSIWGKCAAGDTYNVCDAFLVGCLLFPGRLVRRQKRRKCTVELEGRHTRGQMVVDHVNGSSSGENENEEATRNVTVIELLDVEACKALLLWTVDALDDADWAAEERAKSS